MCVTGCLCCPWFVRRDDGSLGFAECMIYVLSYLPQSKLEALGEAVRQRPELAFFSRIWEGRIGFVRSDAGEGERSDVDLWFWTDDGGRGGWTKRLGCWSSSGPVGRDGGCRERAG